jgi:NADPH-dependent 2,4-dienoyl-CoA reductase/sulfur reductase-like enzyme
VNDTSNNSWATRQAGPAFLRAVPDYAESHEFSPTQRPRRPKLGSADRILIVGAGPAGTASAEELRRDGFRGQIMLICDDPGGPFDRPACSKGILTGHQRPSDARIAVDPRLGIDWRLGRRAVATDLDERIVWAQTGEGFRFDGLIIAAGGRPGLPATWPRAEGLHVLNDLDDAWGIRRDLREASKVVVVGAGLSGCEVACSVRGMGKEVVLIDPQPVVMARALCGPVSEMLTDAHEEDGTEMRLGRRVKDAQHDSEGWILTLDDGETIEADLVLMTAGEKPNISWLAGTGIDTSDGVLCDESMRALDVGGSRVPGVVAAGSLAKWPNFRFGDTPRRCGQWIAALEHGTAAAHALLNGEDRVLDPVTLLPRYWSSQLGMRLQVCGDISPTTDISLSKRKLRNSARSGVLARHFRDGKLVGAVAVNAPTEFTELARTLLSERVEVRITVPALPQSASTAPAAASAPPARPAPAPAPVSAPGARRLRRAV